jgi:hypothetical protein
MKALLYSATSLYLGILASLAVAAAGDCPAHAMSPKAAPMATDAVDSRTQLGKPESADIVVSPTVFIVEEELCIWRQGQWASEPSECLGLSLAPRVGLAAR